MMSNSIAVIWSETIPRGIICRSIKSTKVIYIRRERQCVAIITVPAKFTVNKNSYITSCEKAGFQQCELLQEPVAAAMAYGLNSSEKNGNWMVFDFWWDI